MTRFTLILRVSFDDYNFECNYEPIGGEIHKNIIQLSRTTTERERERINI